MTEHPRGQVDVATGELWLPIPGHNGYEASDHGHIRRVRHRIPTPNSKGYWKVNLGRGNQIYVHQAVMLAHHGPPPAGHNIDHKDFNPANNQLTNLRYRPEPYNSTRWRWREADMDPAEIARIDALYEQAIALGRAPDQAWPQDRPA